MNGETEVGAEYEDLMKESERYALAYRALADIPDHKNRRYSIPDLASREEVCCDSERMLECVKGVKKAVSNNKSLLAEEGIKTPYMDDLLKATVIEAMKIGFLFGELRLRYYELGDLDRGRTARQRDDQTLARANNNRHAEAEARWKPLQGEFRELCRVGMKPDTARSKILNNWAEPKGAPSMKTARKWLRSDGEAD